MRRKRAGELIVFGAPEPRSLTGSPLGSLAEAFPEGYFAGAAARAQAKYRASAKGRATAAALRATWRAKVAA